MLRFYVGVHHLTLARYFDRAFISANTLWDRRAPFEARRWIMDSGAFTELDTHGAYRNGVQPYAALIRRWFGNGVLEAAVAQDFLCSADILKKTGLTVRDHQRLTIQRYDDLMECDLNGVTVIPALQGRDPHEFLEHLDAYGDRLKPGQWVGVGSIKGKNRRPAEVAAILTLILRHRPDLRLHGFGMTETALLHPGVRGSLATADSMAWSFAAKTEANKLRVQLQEELGRELTVAEARTILKTRGVHVPSPHDWREAERFRQTVEDAASLGAGTYQLALI